MHIKSRRLQTLKMYLKTIDKLQIQTLSFAQLQIINLELLIYTSHVEE
jgi:hypothetical protein